MQIVGGKQIALDDPFAGVHPIRVSTQRVDLAVVAHETVRLGAVPGRKRIGAEAGVNHRQMTLVVLVLQVRKIRHHLLGHQLALVDDHLGREATDVEHLGLLHRLVIAQQVTGSLADEVKLPLELVAVEVFAGGNEQLFDLRLRRAGRGSDVGAVGIGRHEAPADERLALFLDEPRDGFFTLITFALDGRQKHQPGGETSRLRKRHAEFIGGHAGEKLVRQRGQKAGPVARIGFAAAGSAMGHVD